MHKKFEKNQTKIKGSCHLGRKVKTHDSKSDLPLANFRQCHFANSTSQMKTFIKHKQGKVRFHLYFCLTVLYMSLKLNDSTHHTRRPFYAKPGPTSALTGLYNTILPSLQPVHV